MTWIRDWIDALRTYGVRYALGAWWENRRAQR